MKKTNLTVNSGQFGSQAEAEFAARKRIIPVSEPSLCGREKEYVMDCIDSGWISSNGKYVNEFESSFAEFIGISHAIAVANGTCALHLALLALGIGPGDEVIVPSFTYIASANAVKYVGATPVFVDSEMDTWNLDPQKTKEAITSRTKAIMVVHLYGHPCDMDQFCSLATSHGLFLIEDAAEAFGSKYNGRMLGTFGDISTFSFFGNKTITSGEGGMVVTPDAVLADKVRLFKGQGMSPTRRYYFDVVGYNYRMTNIQAAIALAQLENAERFINKKRSNAKHYDELLEGIPGIQLPVEKDYALNTYWMYSILIKEDFGMSRDDFMVALAKKGIETRPFFFPCHSLPPYGMKTGILPVAEHIGAQGVNLPSSTKLTLEDIEYVVQAIRACVKS